MSTFPYVGKLAALLPEGASGLTLAQGDLPTGPTFSLVDADNANGAVDLTNATSVQALLYTTDDLQDRVRVWAQPRALSIATPATLGQAALAWISGDTATAGEYELDIQVVTATGTITAQTPIPLTITPLP